MPVILKPLDYDRSLDRGETERLPMDLLRPFDANEMQIHPAKLKVGNIRNNGEDLMRVATTTAETGTLPL